MPSLTYTLFREGKNNQKEPVTSVADRNLEAQVRALDTSPEVATGATVDEQVRLIATHVQLLVQNMTIGGYSVALPYAATSIWDPVSKKWIEYAAGGSVIYRLQRKVPAGAEPQLYLQVATANIGSANG